MGLSGGRCAKRGQSSVLALCDLAEEVVMFKIVLLLSSFGANVILDSGEFEGSLFLGMRELGIVVIPNVLQVSIKGFCHDGKLAFVGCVGIFNSLCCGIGLGLEVLVF